jgi:hypothetical protein
VETRPQSVDFHAERRTSPRRAVRLLQLIEEAAADGRPLFNPFVEMTSAQRREIITLRASIAKLTEVRHLVLHGTNLVRIPSAIEAMSALEVFEP